MKTAIVMDTLPDTKHGGGAMLVGYLISMLESQGPIALVAINDISGDIPENSYNVDANGNHLYSLGIDVNNKKGHVSKQIVHLFHIKALEEIFTECRGVGTLNSIIENEGIEHVVATSWGGACLLSLISENVRKVAVLGDPPFDSDYYRTKFSFIYNGVSWREIKYQLSRKKYRAEVKKYAGNIISKLDAVAAISAYHAKELSLLYDKKVMYIPFPTRISQVIDYSDTHRHNQLTVMMCGHMMGISTRWGIKYLIDEIVPQLEKCGVNYEVRLLGKYYDSLPVALKSRINANRRIVLLGFVDSIQDEYRKSDFMLVPTPIVLGIRTRIISAMAEGVAVVAHAANKQGIPELVDGQNCILGENAEELVQKMLEYVDKPVKMCKLRENARKTAEDLFDFDLVKKRYIELVTGTD